MKTKTFPLPHFFLAVSACLLLVACGSYSSTTKLGNEAYAPVPVEKVEVLLHEPSQPYRVIGVVSADGSTWTTPGQLYRKLQKCAATLGANAVIISEGSYGTLVLPGATTTVANGTATSYGDNTVSAYGTSTSYSGPTYGADLPRDKGLAIKFTGPANAPNTYASPYEQSAPASSGTNTPP